MSGMRVHPRGDAVAVGGGDEARYDRRLRGDDVAVDFPSMVAATERLRAGLTSGEQTPRLQLGIAISAEEAWRGTSVPLDVPLRYTCRSCGGRGESWSAPCAACEGSGTQLSVERLVVRVPRGVANPTTFRFSVTPRFHPTTRVELRVSVGPRDPRRPSS